MLICGDNCILYLYVHAPIIKNFIIMFFFHFREKGSAQKRTIPCPSIIKEYNGGMGGVDLCDQLKTVYALDRRSTFRYYLRIFFDLMDMSCVNSYIVYQKVTATTDRLTLREFKLVVAQKLIGQQNFRKRSFPVSRPSKIAKRMLNENIQPANHLPHFREKRARCVLCSSSGLENRSAVSCQSCDVTLCLQPGRNCFAMYSHA